MDSPGFSAKFCTYTMMDVDSKDILGIKVVDKRQVQLKSPNMELLALKNILQDLLHHGIQIKELVTDAHQGIAKYISNILQICSFLEVVLFWNISRILITKDTSSYINVFFLHISFKNIKIIHNHSQRCI